jgi:hypothetical protein
MRKESMSRTETLYLMADSRIHDLNYKRVEEDIIIEILGIFQRRAL